MNAAPKVTVRPRREAENDNRPTQAWPWSARYPFKALPAPKAVKDDKGKPAGQSWTGNEPSAPRQLSKNWALHFTPRRLVHRSGWHMALPSADFPSVGMLVEHARVRLQESDIAELLAILDREPRIGAGASVSSRKRSESE